MAYKRNGYRGNQTNSFEEVSSVTGVDPVKSDLSKKDKRGIRKAQRKNKSSKVTDDLYKAGIVGIGPSTPAIEVKGSPSQPGTGTGYNIENQATHSVAPIPGTMGKGITLIPPPPEPTPGSSTGGNKTKLNDNPGRRKGIFSQAPSKSKYLGKGGKHFGRVKRNNRGISGKLDVFNKK